MPNLITRYNLDKIPELLEVLKEKALTSREIAKILEMKDKTNISNVSNVMSYICQDYPIFEQEPRLYRLLTKELLEEYEKEELERRRNNKHCQYNNNI